jgi:RimJ/RimL family protein N-acetyltransferase
MTPSPAPGPPGGVERTVALRDGTPVRLRPIRPQDEVALTALYNRLSPETAYQRFFAVMRRLPPDWAHILANVDYDRRMAIVAVDAAGVLIGVARYAHDAASDSAEIALVVQDAWQGRGLGTILLDELLRYAGEHGITRFRAYILADNHRMLRLVSELGLVTERSLDQGVVTLLFTRRPGPPAWRVALRRVSP